MRKKLLASLFILSTLFGLYELNNKAFSFPLKNLPIKGLKNIEKQLKIPSQTNKVNLPENATVDDYLTAIKKQHNQKKYKTVLELSNRAIELDPENEKIHIIYYYRQQANYELGFIEQSFEYLRASLEDNKNIRRINPDDGYLQASYINDILIYSALNENENVINAGNIALNKYKKEAKVAAFICDAYSSKKGFAKEALKVCDKAISLNPKDTDSLLVRATIKFDDLGDKEGGCYDVKQSSLLGNKKSKKLYSQFCATPREQAKEECNNYENMIVMGMNPAAILQGQVALSGSNPKVMEKIRIMRSMCPDVFVERTPSGLFNNNNY